MTFSPKPTIKALESILLANRRSPGGPSTLYTLYRNYKTLKDWNSLLPELPKITLSCQLHLAYRDANEFSKRVYHTQKTWFQPWNNSVLAILQLTKLKRKLLLLKRIFCSLRDLVISRLKKRNLTHNKNWTFLLVQLFFRRKKIYFFLLTDNNQLNRIINRLCNKTFRWKFATIEPFICFLDRVQSERGLSRTTSIAVSTHTSTVWRILYSSDCLELVYGNQNIFNGNTTIPFCSPLNSVYVSSTKGPSEV